MSVGLLTPSFPARSLSASSLSRCFLLFGILLGAAYALFMGNLAIPDEGGHFYRAWLVSDARCIPLPAIGTSLDFRYLDRNVVWQLLPPSTDGPAMLTRVDNDHGRPIGIVALFYAVNLYSCLPYLPAGAALRAGRLFTDSPQTLMYVGRFANLFVYLALTFTALRLLPGFEFPLAILALMPMSLHQAASLSADSFTLGFSFLLIAWILRLATSPSPTSFARRDYLLLALAAVLAGLCKSSAGLLFLLLLIPTGRFRRSSTRWLAVAGLILLGFATAAAWQAINHRNVEIHATLKHAMDVYPDANAQTILQHPSAFLAAVLRTSTRWAFEYLEEFVGKLGWLTIRLPGWIPWLYLALLLAAALASRAVLQLFPWQRLLLAGVFFLNVAAVFAIVWTTEITRQAMNHDFLAGTGYIPGLQGRYLIPVAALPLLALSGLLRFRVPHWVPIPAFALVLLVNTIALGMVWDTYQAHSSTFPNRLGLALHLDFAATPQNAAQRYDDRAIVPRESPGSDHLFLVSGGLRHPVPHLISVTFRGYRIPRDVLLVSQPEIDAIPLGDPLPLPPPGKYEGLLVRRPGDTAEDSKVYIVRDAQKHWITDGHWITANGFKWPGDIKTISAADLAEIPEGDPIR